MEDLVKLQTQIMIDCLNGKIENNHALAMAYTQPVFDGLNTNNAINVRYSNGLIGYVINKCIEITGKELKSCRLNLEEDREDNLYIYFFDELDVVNNLTLLYKIANNDIKNILPILIETDVLGDKILPVFFDKANPLNNSFGCKRYYVTLGEGWGELEFNSKNIEDKKFNPKTTMDKLVDQELLDLWSKNIVEITKTRMEIRNNLENKKP